MYYELGGHERTFMDVIGINSVTNIDTVLLENEIVIESNKAYQNILYKKRLYFSWIDYHKKMQKLACNLGLNLTLYYATFTFSNDKLEGLQMKSFLRYLKRHGVVAYRLNGERGDLHDRFHIHGFICCNGVKDNYSFNLYGWVKLVDFRHIPEEEEETIINYITNYVLKSNFLCGKPFTKWVKGFYNDIGSTSYNIY